MHTSNITRHQIGFVLFTLAILLAPHKTGAADFEILPPIQNPQLLFKETISISLRSTVQAIHAPGEQGKWKVYANGTLTDFEDKTDRTIHTLKIPLEIGTTLLRLVPPDPASPQLWFLAIRLRAEPQKQHPEVVISWEPGVEQVLCNAFNHTIATPIQQDQFTNFILPTLKKSTNRHIKSVFAANGIPISINPQTQRAHTILITPKEMQGMYGHTPRIPNGLAGLNFNATFAMTSSIYIESLERTLRDKRCSAYIDLKETDSYRTRIDDISAMIAHICCHEIGHCLGLVPHTNEGSWLRGDGTGHNSTLSDLRKTLAALDKTYGQQNGIDSILHNESDFIMNPASTVFESRLIGRPNDGHPRNYMRYSPLNTLYLHNISK
ncbi:MAG: hypothetical protein CMJ47_03905 [Planctomyces sp.]|nr:hypothetical protein [Planctomyces sp.]